MTYPKRMQNEEHGFTHAYTESEEAYLVSLGWKPEEEKKPKTLTLPKKASNAVQ